MGLRLETYNNNFCGLIVDYSYVDNSDYFYANDDIKGAMEYFNLYIDDKTAMIKKIDPNQKVIDKLGINSSNVDEFKNMIGEITNSFTDEQALNFKLLIPNWVINKQYEVNDRVRYLENIYKVIKAHISAKELVPDISKELFENISKEELVAVDWVSTEIYNIGKQVTHNGSVWESLIDNNSIEPGTDDAAWKLIGILESEFPTYDPEIVYSIGEKVNYNGSIYVSLIDNNTVSPVEDLTAWELM